MKNGFDLSGEDNFKKFRKDFIIYPFIGGIGERNRGRSFPLTESCPFRERAFAGMISLQPKEGMQGTDIGTQRHSS